MGMPAVLNLNGTTGFVYWIPDWMQTPFSVGVALVSNGAAGTAAVEASLQNIDPLQANGTAPTNATWIPVIAAAALTTAAVATSWSMPVQAFRLNVSGAVATATVQVQFVQATYGR